MRRMMGAASRLEIETGRLSTDEMNRGLKKFDEVITGK
jgi:hypothetical protein